MALEQFNPKMKRPNISDAKIELAIRSGAVVSMWRRKVILGLRNPVTNEASYWIDVCDEDFMNGRVFLFQSFHGSIELSGPLADLAILRVRGMRYYNV